MPNRRLSSVKANTTKEGSPHQGVFLLYRLEKPRNAFVSEAHDKIKKYAAMLRYELTKFATYRLLQTSLTIEPAKFFHQFDLEE